MQDPLSNAWAGMLALAPSQRDEFLRQAMAFSLAADAPSGKSAIAALVRGSPSPGPQQGCDSVVASAGAGDEIATRLHGSRSRPATPALPLIGGSALATTAAGRFTDPGFKRLWRPGRRLLVYIAGCRGLANLMRSSTRPGAGAPPVLMAYKIGTFIGSDVSLRMAKLNKLRYASLWIEDGTPRTDTGFDSWSVEPLQLGTFAPQAGSPVKVGTEGLEVVLPAGMGQQDFERSVERALCGASLHGFAGTTAGQQYCRDRGIDPHRFIRHSPKGAATSPAKELILIRPKHDLGRLICVCENIVHDYVLSHGVQTPK